MAAAGPAAPGPVRRGLGTVRTPRCRRWSAAGTGRWNVYLSTRDAVNRARIGRSVLTLEPFPALRPLDQEPVLDLGERGAFDEDGVTVSCVVPDGSRRLLYYTGWQRGGAGEARFTLTAGLAVDEGDGRFHRPSSGPVLERTEGESSFTASPFVLRERNLWRMWYVAGSSWRSVGSREEPCYDIRYAESPDGASWSRLGSCIAHTARSTRSAGHGWFGMLIAIECGSPFAVNGIASRRRVLRRRHLAPHRRQLWARAFRPWLGQRDG